MMFCLLKRKGLNDATSVTASPFLFVFGVL